MGQKSGSCLGTSNHSLITISEKGQSQTGKYSPTHTETFQKDYPQHSERNDEKNTIKK